MYRATPMISTTWGDGERSPGPFAMVAFHRAAWARLRAGFAGQGKLGTGHWRYGNGQAFAAALRGGRDPSRDTALREW